MAMSFELRTHTVHLTVGTRQFFHNITHECLGVAEEHQRLVHVIKRIVNAREAWIHAALDDHHSV